MDRNPSDPGRLQRAPESFVDRDGVRTVFAQARHGRRDFIRSAFAAATAAVEVIRRKRRRSLSIGDKEKRKALPKQGLSPRRS